MSLFFICYVPTIKYLDDHTQQIQLVYDYSLLVIHLTLVIKLDLFLKFYFYYLIYILFVVIVIVSSQSEEDV